MPERSAGSCCSDRPTEWRCVASGCRAATLSPLRWARYRWPPKRLGGSPRCRRSPTTFAAHELEHSLEVELPFLQFVLDRFELLPLVVGEATGEEVAQVLEAVWGGPETRIVISSDLSHYLPYDRARAIDGDTARAIVELEAPLERGRACGGLPIDGLIVAARRHGLTARLLDLRNSGDTAGDRHRVVGYGAFDFLDAA